MADESLGRFSIEEAEALRQRSYLVAGVMRWRGLKDVERRLICRECDASINSAALAFRFVIEHRDHTLELELVAVDAVPLAKQILDTFREREELTIPDLVSVTGLSESAIRKRLHDPDSGLIEQGIVRVLNASKGGRGKKTTYGLVGP
jgi:hypothetical protein